MNIYYKISSILLNKYVYNVLSALHG